MTIRTTVLALISLGILAVNAQNKQDRGGNRGGNKGKWLQQLDANGDGQIDDAEAEQAATVQIERIQQGAKRLREQFDVNGDGTLDQNEVATMQAKLEETGKAQAVNRQLGQLKKIDADGNFAIDANEEAKMREQVVARIKQMGKGGQKAAPQQEQKRGNRQPQAQGMGDPDTDGNCIIDEMEAQTAAEREVERFGRMLEMLKERSGGKRNPMVDALDPNGNWELDAEEATKIAEGVVALLQERNELMLKFFDADGDGELNKVELETAKKAVAFAKDQSALEQKGRQQIFGGGQQRRPKQQ